MLKLGAFLKSSVNTAAFVRNACGPTKRIEGCNISKRAVNKPEKPASCKLKECPLTRQEKCLKCADPEPVKVPCGRRKAKFPPTCVDGKCDHLKKKNNKKN